MAGVYNAMYTPNVFSDETIAANILSDGMLGAGGPDDAAAKYMDNFEDPTEDTYRDLWVQSYNGIARTNAIIEKQPMQIFLHSLAVRKKHSSLKIRQLVKQCL